MQCRCANSIFQDIRKEVVKALTRRFKLRHLTPYHFKVNINIDALVEHFNTIISAYIVTLYIYTHYTYSGL